MVLVSFQSKHLSYCRRNSPFDRFAANICTAAAGDSANIWTTKGGNETRCQQHSILLYNNKLNFIIDHPFSIHIHQSIKPTHRSWFNISPEWMRSAHKNEMKMTCWKFIGHTQRTWTSSKSFIKLSKWNFHLHFFEWARKCSILSKCWRCFWWDWKYI